MESLFLCGAGRAYRSCWRHLGAVNQEGLKPFSTTDLQASDLTFGRRIDPLDSVEPEGRKIGRKKEIY